ncbi:MAG: hypothetical protein ACKOWF_02790, partial [Chloroflexota bacterium]
VGGQCGLDTRAPPLSTPCRKLPRAALLHIARGAALAYPCAMNAAAFPDPPALAADVPVECFGVPRLLAGPAVPCRGRTLAELARDLGRQRPALLGPVLDPAAGWLLPGYVFVLDGAFTRDPAAPVRPGAAVLLVAAAAGG